MKKEEPGEVRRALFVREVTAEDIAEVRGAVLFEQFGLDGSRHQVTDAAARAQALADVAG